MITILFPPRVVLTEWQDSQASMFDFHFTPFCSFTWSRTSTSYSFHYFLKIIYSYTAGNTDLRRKATSTIIIRLLTLLQVNVLSTCHGSCVTDTVPYLFTFSFWRISVASFFLGVSTGVTGAEEGADVSADIWGPWLAVCCWGARGLLHWSQYTLTYSRDIKKQNNLPHFVSGFFL